jgi:hypothetical protein
MATTILFTKEGGRYYRAKAFFYIFTFLLITPLTLLVVFGILNPFWFRDRFFYWVENTVKKIAEWRNYQKYKIYLGIDPKVWHTLKD